MNRVVLSAAVIPLAALIVMAERPLGTVMGQSAIAINGVKASAPGVTSWPLTIGDELTITGGGAYVRLPGLKVALGADSTARLERAGQATIFRLTEGSMRYSLQPNAIVQIYALSQRLRESEMGVAILNKLVEKSKGHGPPLTPPGHRPDKPPERSKH